MKLHTTNYYNSFIEVSPDIKQPIATRPASKTNKTVAEIQYSYLSENPYIFTSDDIIFQVFADRNDLRKEEYKSARAEFFSKSQACLRTSPLAKRYGFGIHFNNEGKIALYAMESKLYQGFLDDAGIKKYKAMRSGR